MAVLDNVRGLCEHSLVGLEGGEQWNMVIERQVWTRLGRAS